MLTELEFATKHTKFKFGERAFSVAEPSVWNTWNLLLNNAHSQSVKKKFEALFLKVPLRSVSMGVW